MGPQLRPGFVNGVGLIHPDLGVGAEWRFVYFRSENARALVNVSLSLVVQFLGAPKGKNDQLKQYAQAMSPLIKPLVEEWESPCCRAVIWLDTRGKVLREWTDRLTSATILLRGRPSAPRVKRRSARVHWNLWPVGNGVRGPRRREFRGPSATCWPNRTGERRGSAS